MLTTVSVNLLESIPCLAGLSPEARERLLKSVIGRSFAKGEVVMLEGEPCPGVFVVESGAVKLYRTSAKGEEQIVRIIHPGGCFECAPIFDRGPNPMSAQALEATRAYLLPVSDFRSVLSTQPRALLEILAIMSLRIRSLLNMVEDFSFRRVPARLANLLLQLSEQQNDAPGVSPSIHRLNQQHLACMLGCSRQAVNNALQKLRRDDIIKIEGRRIVVLKPEALKNLL